MTVNLTIKHSIPYDLVLGSDWHLWCRDTLPNDKIQQPLLPLNLVRWMLMLNLKLCSNTQNESSRVRVSLGLHRERRQPYRGVLIGAQLDRLYLGDLEQRDTGRDQLGEGYKRLQVLVLTITPMSTWFRDLIAPLVLSLRTIGPTKRSCLDFKRGRPAHLICTGFHKSGIVGENPAEKKKHIKSQRPKAHAARVYSLRCLLVSTIPAMRYPLYSPRLYIIALTTGILIWVHHLLAIFRWTMRGLAVIDLAAVVIEIGAPGFFLLLTLLFRITTTVKTKERLLSQRFALLGCCLPSHPPYTPVLILLNRSLVRPLVRGESKYTIMIRAIVLTCIGIGVPAFGIYATLIKPTHAVVSTIVIENPPINLLLPSLANATISLTLVNVRQTPFNYIQRFLAPLEVVVTVPPVANENRTINCPTVVTMNPTRVLATCSVGWSEIQSITFSAVIPRDLGLLSVDLGCDSGLCDDGLGITVQPGSHLFGVLAWTLREKLSDVRHPETRHRDTLSKSDT
ncbi:hypothetical protein C8R45DRAFT_938736 [Mycena sanguinolenta]|nr:hypothetical protein C8R45DRAFT_938736 [Mycena sanguinolenta]